MPYPVQDNQTPTEPTTTNPEVITRQVAPITSAPAAPNSNAATPPAEDLITRASQVALEPKAPESNADILDGSGFDRNQWNSMLDTLPADQRTQLESAYKSLQRGADTKFQKAAEMTRNIQDPNEPWTLDRIQKLTQDQSFVQAAQQYSQINGDGTQAPTGLSEEEYSNLSDSEQRKFDQLTRNQSALQNQLANIMMAQEDEKLLSVFKNYDAKVVGGIRKQLQSGQVIPNSEDIWKAIDYEPAIQRAYKLGLSDRQLDVGQKLEANTPGGGGVNIIPSGDTPVKEKGENTVNFFRRLAQHNIKRVAEAQRQQHS